MAKIKKIFFMFLVFAMTASLMQTKTYAVKRAKLSKSKLSLKVGKTYTLRLKNVKSKKVKWSSSKKSVATVSRKGKIRAKKKGKCKIIAKYNAKKYICRLTVTKKVIAEEPIEESTKYGSLSGNITYFYNKYRGNVADTGAIVILLSESGEGKSMPDLSSYVDWAMPATINQYNEYGVYATKVDGFGQYTINNVVVGDYKLIILSNETTSGEAFNNKDVYASSLSNIAASFVNRKNADMLGQYVGYNKYVTDNVSIKENQKFTYGYDFGVTYI